MVKDPKSLSWSSWSFLQHKTNTSCWSGGELTSRMSSWREFCFNPVAAIPWSCIPLSALQSSEPPRWLSHPFPFGHHLPKFTMCCSLQRDLFCSSHGDYAEQLGIVPFPVCEVIHIAAVMHHELCKPNVCVLWLDLLTQARSFNGKDFCLSRFRPVWDLLLVHHRPQWLLITSVNLSALHSGGSSCGMPLSSAGSPCFCLQFTSWTLTL